MKSVLRDYRSILFIFVGVMLFRTAIADWNYVPSGSMEPTLFAGDAVLVNKMAYGPTIPFTDIRLLQTGQPQRGDIITFYPPHRDDLFVKRVVGVPGDVVEFRGKDVYLNGALLDTRLIGQIGGVWRAVERLGDVLHDVQYSGGGLMPFSNRPVVVPQGHYFVMGDHRNNSADSRFWGFVSEDKVMGKVGYLALSVSSHRELSKRIAQPLR